jgi:hypothetical protein
MQATLKRLRVEVAPRIAEEISRKFRRQEQPDEIGEILDEGHMVVWGRRDELQGPEDGDWRESYRSACMKAAHKRLAAGRVRERRQAFGVEQAFLDGFEARRPRDEHETLGGVVRAASCPRTRPPDAPVQFPYPAANRANRGPLMSF